MILEGRIIKGIGGFYYVDAARTLYECRARGLFRKQGRTPLVGDIVDIEPIQEKEGTAYLVDIHERKSCLIRPAVANADQVILIFSVMNPSPRRELIDRFLLNMEMQEIETILCISKMDLEGEEGVEEPFLLAGVRVGPGDECPQPVFIPDCRIAGGKAAIQQGKVGEERHAAALLLPGIQLPG